MASCRLEFRFMNNTFGTWGERSNYFVRLRDQIATLPDVISTGISTNATPPDSGWTQPFEVQGKAASEDQKASINFVDSRYFSTFRNSAQERPVMGRDRTQRGALMAVVNETFAKHYYPKRNILDRSVKIPSIKSNPPENLVVPGSDGWLQIIGVTADALDDGVDKPVKPAIYLPFTLNMRMWSQILVRSRVDPRNIVS